MMLSIGRRIRVRFCPGPENRGAFTLIEMVLVVFFITVLAGVALPHFSRSWARLQLQNAAYELSYMMRFAQSLAISKGIPVRLTFTQDAHAYTLNRAPGISQENGESVSSQSLSGRWGRSVSIPADIEVDASPEGAVFFPDGRIEAFQCQFCRGTDCYLVSTAGSRGMVDVWPFSSEL